MSPIVELIVSNSESNQWMALEIVLKSAGLCEPCHIWSWENIPKRSMPDLSYTNQTISLRTIIYTHGSLKLISATENQILVFSQYFI